ncbi:MAG: hypothetical protein Q4A53_02105 [Porphyromonas sp.]|nr:hypothetical protein [Porphyromonas sp.]
MTKNKTQENSSSSTMQREPQSHYYYSKSSIIEIKSLTSSGMKAKAKNTIPNHSRQNSKIHNSRTIGTSPTNHKQKTQEKTTSQPLKQAPPSNLKQQNIKKHNVSAIEAKNSLFDQGR